MSKSNNAKPIPTTVAGGTKAAAIATPTKMPGIIDTMAIPAATPSSIPITTSTGDDVVLDSISVVIGKSTNCIATKEIAELTAITVVIRINPETNDWNIFFGLPIAALKEKAVRGPMRGEISIAPITTAGLFMYRPVRAITVDMIIMMNRSFLNRTNGSVCGISSSTT